MNTPPAPLTKVASALHVHTASTFFLSSATSTRAYVHHALCMFSTEAFTGTLHSGRQLPETGREPVSRDAGREGVREHGREIPSSP